ncbi:MAG: hypothetical protein PHV20_06735 [Bacteroidales bacterium]|nr:hypothetical protein [Bacteroidales bacterium]
MIVLPETIRTARFDEIPKDSLALEKLQKISNAKIVEGYTLKFNNKPEHKDIPFLFYSEINVNYDRLWDLITKLAESLPGTSSLLIGESESDLIYCDYTDTKILMKTLAKYKTELTADAFLEWGIIFNNDKILIELFVSDAKYIKFWGVELDKFKSIMECFNLPLVDDLEFIDEYPCVREPLSHFNESVQDTDKLIQEISGLFITKEAN